MAGLTPVDRVMGITIGTIAGAVTITPKDPLWTGVMAVFSFSFVSWLLGKGVVLSGRIRTLLQGHHRRVVQDGRPLKEGLQATGLGLWDLEMQLREAVVTLPEVKEAYLETHGHLGIVRREKPVADGRSKKPSTV